MRVASRTFGLAVILFSAGCVSFSPDPLRGVASAKVPTVVALERVPGISGTPFLRAEVNGRPGLFLLDTGATATVLDLEYADALRLDRRPLGGLLVRTNVEGRLYRAHVDLFSIGDHEFSGFDVAVVDLSHFRRTTGYSLDGILGTNILERSPFLIDSGAGTVTFGADPVRGPVLPLSGGGGRYFVGIESHGRTFTLLLDTGATLTSLSRRDFSRLVKASGIEPAIQSETILDINRVNTSEFRMLRVDVRSGRYGVSGLSIQEHDQNLLGMDFFVGLPVWIDLQRREMRVQTTGTRLEGRRVFGRSG